MNLVGCADCGHRKPSGLLCLATILVLLHALLVCCADGEVLGNAAEHNAASSAAIIKQNLHRFTCPRGAYLDTSPTTLAEKERVLQGHVQKLLQDGYELMPGWETGVKLAGRRMWTFSDPMWPKPANCREVWGDAAAIYNDCMTTNTGRIVVNHKHRFFIRLVAKAASTTILQTAMKMVKGSQVVHYDVDGPAHNSATCHRGVDPPSKDSLRPYSGSQRYLLLGHMREPMDRFISAFNHYADRTGHGPKTRVADFMDVIKKGFECADYTWGARSWVPKSFAHFMPAVGYFLLPHLLHAADNETVPVIDKMFRMEQNMGELIPFLERVTAGAVVAGPSSAGNAKQQVLPKVEANMANVLPHEPLTVQLMKALSEQPEMVRIHCRAFIQDYVCFDYPLPRECADMAPGGNRTSSLAHLPSIDWSGLDKEYREGTLFKLDETKVNRLFLVIIGVLMVIICWQQYKLNREEAEVRSQLLQRVP